MWRIALADFKDGSTPNTREALWQKWFGLGLLSATSVLYFADAGGADKDSLIKGFLGGYVPSACMLGYTSFVTGDQDTVFSKVCQTYATRFSVPQRAVAHQRSLSPLLLGM